MEHTVFAAMFWVHVLSAGIAEGFLGRRKQHYDKHKSFFYIVECRLLKLLVKMSLVRTSCLSLSVLLWTYVLNQELSLCMKTFWFVETRCGFVELLYGKWNMERLSISVPLSKVLVSFIDLVVTVFILFSSPFSALFFSFVQKAVLNWNSSWEQEQNFSPFVLRSTSPPPSLVCCWWMSSVSTAGSWLPPRVKA